MSKKKLALAWKWSCGWGKATYVFKDHGPGSGERGASPEAHTLGHRKVPTGVVCGVRTYAHKPYRRLSPGYLPAVPNTSVSSVALPWVL